MKAEIHPTLYPVVFVDGELEIVIRFTKKFAETREINGIEHFVIPIDISAFTHPFFTGKQRLIDTEGRVERFRRRFGSRGGNAKTSE
jgi:large subunit ribosomal protein L31